SGRQRSISSEHENNITPSALRSYHSARISPGRDCTTGSGLLQLCVRHSHDRDVGNDPIHTSHTTSLRSQFTRDLFLGCQSFRAVLWYDRPEVYAFTM